MDCIEACANYNKNTGTCAGVTYDGNITAVQLGAIGNNCFLKDLVGVNVRDPSNLVATAMLV